MGSAIERPPMTAPIGKVGAGGVVLLTPEWAQYLSRLGALQEHGTESGTTAQRPTKDLYDGRKYFDTTLGAVVHYKTATSEWVRVIDTDTDSDTFGVEVLYSQSAASATTVDFVHGSNGVSFEAGYDYEIDIEGLVPTTDAAQVGVQVGDSGGFKATSYRDALRGYNDGNALVAIASTTDTKVALTATGTGGLGNDTGENLSATISFGDFTNTSLHKLIRGHVGWVGSDQRSITAHFNGRWTGGVTALDRIRVQESTGNGFSAGTVTLRRKLRS